MSSEIKVKRDRVAVEMGKRLRRARRAKNISQLKLAAKARVSPGSIGNYEQGTRRIGLDRAKKFAKALDVSAAYLLGLE